jgi:hypothetical protein
MLRIYLRVLFCFRGSRALVDVPSVFKHRPPSFIFNDQIYFSLLLATDV